LRGDEHWAERVRRLEGELSRARRSRRILMDLLVRLDGQWRQRLAHLEEENRRLWAGVPSTRGVARPPARPASGRRRGAAGAAASAPRAPARGPEAPRA
jgi:hypothetical protein